MGGREADLSDWEGEIFPRKHPSLLPQKVVVVEEEEEGGEERRRRRGRRCCRS